MKLFLPVCALAVGFTTMIGLYTNNQIESLTQGLVQSARYAAQSEDGVLDLANIIRRNNDAVLGTDWVSWEVNSERFATWKISSCYQSKFGQNGH